MTTVEARQAPARHRRMRSSIALALVVVLSLGCSSGEDPAGAPCTTQDGVEACEEHATAFCTRIVACCTARGSCDPKCVVPGMGDSCTLAGCRHINSAMDCDPSLRPKYKTPVCKEATRACTSDFAVWSCDKLPGEPTSCPAFK